LTIDERKGLAETEPIPPIAPTPRTPKSPAIIRKIEGPEPIGRAASGLI
jgi:hypothetical protein